MAEDKLAALERLSLVQADALRVLIDHVRAITTVNAALLAHLGDGIDRDVIREAALGAIGTGKANASAAALVEALTQDPAAAVVEHHAALTAALSNVPMRLN